ncbi:hypothetical protein EV368DRAFT_83653 [Lentinula lateritia]|nr:hypothetical protein EV368DRAFT_83653 [Lentinula lateritia]
MSLAAPTVSSFDGEDVAMEDRAMVGRFDFGQFRGQKKSRGGVAEGGNGDLVDSIRDAVSSVLGDFNLSQFDLVYPESEPEPVKEDADDEPDFDDFDLVYPETPPASPPPPLAPVISEAPLPSEESAEPPLSQLEPIQPRLLIRIPSRKALQSPTKQPPTNNRPASQKPAVFTATSTPQNLFVSTPLPPTGTLAAHQPSQKLQTDILPPRVPQITSLRLCSNTGCNGVVRVDGTRRRCMGCIMKGWTSGNYVPPAESVKEPAQIVQKRKSSKKRVSWFDGYGKDERKSQDAMDVDEDEEIQAVSTETDNDALGAGVLVPGWDSDLTESDEDDPNLDSMLANEPDPSADCNVVLSSGYSSVSCTIKHCRNFLPLNYTWKCCPTCRKHRREYQRKRLGCDIEKDKFQGDQSTYISPSGSASIPLKVHSSSQDVQNYDYRLIAYIFRRFTQKTNWDHTPYTIPQVSSLSEPGYAPSAAASTSFPTKLSTSSSCASPVGFAVPGFGKQERKSRKPCQACDLSNMLSQSQKAFPLVDVPPPQNPLRAAVGRCASMDCGLKLEPSKLKSFQTKAKNRLNVADMGMLASLTSPVLGATGDLGETENVETDDTEALCDQCTWRRLPPDVRRSRKVEVHRRVRIVLDSERDSTNLHTDGGPSQLKPCIRPNVPAIRLPQRPIPPPKPRNPTPYPEYQSIAHLICDLQSLFKSFIQAQGFYLAFNLTRKQNFAASTGHTNKSSEPPHVHNSEAPFSDTTNSTDVIPSFNSLNSPNFSNNPSSSSASELNPIIPRTMSQFAFDGEFSIVAPDFELLERKDEVTEFVTSAMYQIEKVASVKFLPSSRLCVVAYGGLITRFACRGMVPMILPPGVTPTMTVPLMRDMFGELEVVVLPVDSHRCFPVILSTTLPQTIMGRKHYKTQKQKKAAKNKVSNTNEEETFADWEYRARSQQAREFSDEMYRRLELQRLNCQAWEAYVQEEVDIYTGSDAPKD